MKIAKGSVFVRTASIERKGQEVEIEYRCRVLDTEGEFVQARWSGSPGVPHEVEIVHRDVLAMMLRSKGYEEET
jgi:hypothetical protein